MIHLNDEQLYNLAELTMEMQPYNEEEMEQMQHVKDCKICYDKFCSILVLLEVTDESGFMVLSEIYSEAHERVKIGDLSKNILGVVKVVWDKAEKGLTAIMEQVEDMKSIFQFEQPFALATRGMEGSNITVYKLEDIDDEKTFIMFDVEKNELFVQINIKNIEYKNIRIFIEFENGDKLNIPVKKSGNFVKGNIKNISEHNFEIHIGKVD